MGIGISSERTVEKFCKLSNAVHRQTKWPGAECWQCPCPRTYYTISKTKTQDAHAERTVSDTVSRSQRVPELAMLAACAVLRVAQCGVTLLQEVVYLAFPHATP